MKLNKIISALYDKLLLSTIFSLTSFLLRTLRSRNLLISYKTFLYIKNFRATNFHHTECQRYE